MCPKHWEATDHNKMIQHKKEGFWGGKMNTAESLKIKYEKFYKSLSEEEQKLFIDLMIMKATAHMIENGLIEKIE